MEGEKELFPGQHTNFPDEHRFWLPLTVQEGNSTIQLATYRWGVDSPKAVVFHLHGLNSCSDNIAVCAKRLAQNRIESVSFDLRPFGQSTSRYRANFHSVDTLLSDSTAYYHKVIAQYPGLPIFALGHSLGGHLALRMSLSVQPRFRGMILLTPFVDVPAKMLQSRLLRYGLVLARPLIGRFGVQTGKINKSYRVREAYRHSQSYSIQYKHKLQFATITAMLQSCAKLRSNWSSINTPMLIFRAGQDKVIDNTAIDKMMAACSSTDKTVIDLPDAWHALVRDPDIYGAMDIATEWIEKRVIK